MNYLVIAIAALILVGLSYLGYILIFSKEKLTDEDECPWPTTTYEPPAPGYYDGGRSMPSDPPGTLEPNNRSDDPNVTWYTWNPNGAGDIPIKGPLKCNNISNSPCTWDGVGQCLKLGNQVIDANGKIISEMIN